MRVHCVLRIYLPLLQVMHEEYHCVKDSSGGHRRNPCVISIVVSSMFIFIPLFTIIPHSDIWYCNNVIFKNFGCMKWISIITRSHYWILGGKCGSFEFSLGVCPMDTIRCSWLSGCLVSGGRRAPP